MSNITVTDTTYNITVSETSSSVEVTSGDAITVLVDTFTISTAVINSGSGAAVGKEITGDTLYLRSIVAGDDIVVAQNTDDITISLASNIDANLTGDTSGTHFGAVQGNLTGDVVGNLTGNITSTNSTINVINDVSQINNTNNITITPQTGGYLHANVGNVYVGTLTQAAHITGTEIKSVGTTLEITGNLTGNVEGDLTGDVVGNLTGSVTGQVSDISNHTTTDLTEGTNLYWTQNRFDTAFSLKDTGDLTEGVNLYYTDGRFDARFATKTTTDLTEGTNLYYTQARFDSAFAAKDTGDLTEGSNLYYTDARVNTVLGDLAVDIIPSTQSGVDLGDSTTYFGRAYIDQIYTVDLLPKTQQRIRSYGHIHPAGNKTYDLGSPTLQWRSAYIGPGSLYIDGQKVLGSDVSGAIDMTTDAGQNLNISSGADIQFLTQGNATGTQAFTVKLDEINLGDPSFDTATVNVNGLLEAPDLHIGDLELDATLINQTATNQNLEIRTNGTGYLHANTATAYFGSLTQAVSITGTGIGSVGNTISIVGDLTGDVTGQVSDISNHDTDDISEGTTNLYYTDSRARSAISLTSTNTAELSYDSATGVFSYVSPTTVTASNAVTLQVRNASGVAIAKGDAVYISGHSGNKVLIAKADANATGKYPAIGLAAGAMANNTDGEVTVYGELAGVNTSTYSVGDVLYLSETAGELTNVRPSSSGTAVQNIGKVARADSNGIIIISGSGRANDVPNLDHLNVFIGNTTGYETRQLDTSDILEDASNLFYTDTRARAAISASGSLSYNSSTGEISYTQPTNVSAFTNDAGYLTSYTETDPIYTASSWYSTTNNSANWDTAYGWGDHSIAGYLTDLSGQTTSNLTEGSNLYFTDARAISAVEGEATLDLTGDITIAQDLDVSGLVKVNDGYTLGSFNPYAGYGGTSMNTTIMGIGQESGWAGVSIRSRGEHDWGLSGYGIPPEAPRALLALQGGRLDGSSDDYLNSGDKFAEMMFNPYSGYRTGTEWLTPSAMIEALATENHSSSGMGTKLVLKTTTNGSFAGSTDASHTDGEITIQGTTITTNDTLKIDDDLQVTGSISNPSGDIIINDKVEINGSNAKETVIGDDQIAGVYDIHGIKVKADDTAWGSILIQEYVGGASKPFASGFANPSFGTEIIGGTPSSPTNVDSGKRLFLLQALAANQTDGTLPTTSNFRIKAETTETQTSSARGTKVSIETIQDGNTGTTETLKLQGNEVRINPAGDGVIGAGNDLRLGSQLDTNGNNIINNSGDVTVDDNLKVNSSLTVDGSATFNGNMTLGNANTDTITATGKLNTTNGFRFTVMDTATANYISGVLGIASTGDAAYISDGDSGNPCLAVYNGSSWKRIALGSDISSS